MLLKRKIKQEKGEKRDSQDKGLRPLQAYQQKAAGKIASLLLKTQLAFARLMNKYTSGISVHALKILLAVFFTTGIGLSMYCMITALTPKNPDILRRPDNIQFLQTDTLPLPTKK